MGSLLAATVMLAACNEHTETYEPGVSVGDVVCSDGVIRSAETFAITDYTPVAVVFHASEGTGYAVYIHDVRATEFADSIGVSQGTSADITALDGNDNTYALFKTTAVNSPMAASVFDIWCYGQSAYVPSVAQLRLLQSSLQVVNSRIIECGGTPMDISGNCWYWSSTEVAGQQPAKAWLVSMASGAIQETPKSQAHRVRPIITIQD